MKILSKIKIHPLFYFILLLTFFIGYLKKYLVFTLIIIVHEMGHIFAAKILKWEIKKVTLYPFGGMTTFNQKINSSLIEEFLILIYGPLFQILFHIIYPLPYHNFILFFNLLPIYPLDGSKFIYIFLNNFISLYFTYIIVFILSVIMIIIILLKNISLITIIICTYLLYEVYLYYKKINILMLKFYYERYQNNYKYRRKHIIKGIILRKMLKNKINYFFNDKKIYTEYEILAKRFDK